MTETGATDEGVNPGLDPATWRLAVVAGVRMEMPGEYPEVLVHEAVAPWRELAIPVGMADGNAIAYAWRSLTTPRPLTHALFTDVLERHGVMLEAVRITARRGRSYFAELDTTGPRGRQIIPCRPSDAFALVLRQRMPTPVLVADWVFDPEPEELESAASDEGPAVGAASTPTVETTEQDTTADPAPDQAAGVQPTDSATVDGEPSAMSAEPPSVPPTDAVVTDGSLGS